MALKVYLWGIEYSRDCNCAKAIIYVPEHRKFYALRDWTGHRPYFLVKMEPEKVRMKLEGQRGVEAVIPVRLRERLYNRESVFAKVIVDNPLRVRELRELFPPELVYEANIKYHRNYQIDTNLETWMPYRIVKTPSGQYALQPDGWEPGDWNALFEAEIPVPDWAAFDIEVLPEAPYRVPDAEEAKQPVISVAIVDSRGKQYLFMLKEYCPKRFEPKDELIDKDNLELRCFEREEDLLRAVVEKLKEYPLIVGYNIELFDVPYIRNRGIRLGLWSEENAPFEVTGKGRHPVSGEDCWHYEPSWGRLFDLFELFGNTSIKNYTFGGAYQTNSLEAVSEALLGKTKKFEGQKSVLDMTPEELAEYNLVDAVLTAELFKYDEYLPFKVAVLFGRISRLGVGDVFRSTISAWIGQLFLWAHRKEGNVLPNKEELEKTKGIIKSQSKTGKQYAGAMVFEPKPGVYKNVYVFDYASLYPTVNINKNISYETVNPLFPCEKLAEVPEVGHKVCLDFEGIQPKVLRILRDLRVKKYKKLAKDKSLPEEKRKFYDAVQMSLKVFINASYGVFGDSRFQLFTPPVAESITAWGRYAITNTKKFVEEKLGFKVLYGDSVTGDAGIWVKGCASDDKCWHRWTEVPIEELFLEVHTVSEEGKEYFFPKELYTLAFNPKEGVVVRRIKYVMRHKTDKKIYTIYGNVGQKLLSITEDHSLLAYKECSRKLVPITPKRLIEYLNEFGFAELRILSPFLDDAVAYHLIRGHAEVVEEGQTSDYVYDIEVDGEEHNFFANGVLVHNTDSIFVWNENRPIPEEAQREIQSYVKQNFELEIELDKVFKALILTDRKKNYLGILQDGKVVITGLLVKKRSTPKFVKDAFAELLDILVKHLSSDELNVEEIRRESERVVRNWLSKLYFRKLPLQDIAVGAEISQEEYKAKSQTAQVLAYFWLKGVDIKKGDFIKYVKYKETSPDVLIVPKGFKFPWGEVARSRTVWKTVWVPVEPVNFAKYEKVDLDWHAERLRSALEQIFAGLGIPVPNVKAIGKQTALLRFLSKKN